MNSRIEYQPEYSYHWAMQNIRYAWRLNVGVGWRTEDSHHFYVIWSLIWDDNCHGLLAPDSSNSVLMGQKNPECHWLRSQCPNSDCWNLFFRRFESMGICPLNIDGERFIRVTWLLVARAHWQRSFDWRMFSIFLFFVKRKSTQMLLLLSLLLWPTLLLVASCVCVHAKLYTFTFLH